MKTRDEWFASQLAVLEALVKEERQRLQTTREQQARAAIIQMSLPELLGHVGDDQQDASEQPSVH